MGDFTAAGAVGGNPYGAPGPSATGLPGAPPANVVPPSEKTTTQVSLPDKVSTKFIRQIKQIEQWIRIIKSSQKFSVNPVGK